MEARVLFWNTFKRPLVEEIVSIVNHHDINLVALAENPATSADLVAEFRGAASPAFRFVSSQSDKVKVRLFSRLQDVTISDVCGDPNGYLSIKKVIVKGIDEYLLALVHLPSKLHLNNGGLMHHAMRVCDLISSQEDFHNLHRTMVLGDFNMDPFESGMVGARAFHAVMTAKEAERGVRLINGEKYRMFYNPMWGQYGDRSDGPPGSYYFPDSTNPHNQFWHVYDQVLLRPSLMTRLTFVRVLEHTGAGSLVTQHGRPRRSRLSDHLPIIFGIEL